jgi:hypothetical protein
MGSGKMGIGYNDQILLCIEFNVLNKKNLLLAIGPAKEEIFNIPIFHYSMSVAKFQPALNIPNFSES